MRSSIPFTFTFTISISISPPPKLNSSFNQKKKTQFLQSIPLGGSISAKYTPQILPLSSPNRMGVPETNMTMVFTYGTLKRGFSNHALMQDLIATRDAVFIGACRTADRMPLVCGPYRVPFLLNDPGAGERVWGELYAVSRKGIVRMDELEGISRGHYERLPIKLVVAKSEDESDEVVEAEAYFGHRSYAAEMWRRSGERGYAVYSEKEAKGYVKRKDRPIDLTFLDHIRIFLTAPSPSV